MPRKRNGEFEILLGNKQLLSIFFIVVILLGVFFTMGYVLGRKSTPADTSVTASAKKTAPDAILPAEQTGRGSVSAFPDESPRGVLKEGRAASARDSSQPGQVQLPASTQEAEQPKPLVSAPPVPAEPVPGETYLQVAAVKQPEAELVADVLKKKGFPSLIAAHPSEPVFRVLVGPLADADAIATTRAGLESAGFKPILRKY